MHFRSTTHVRFDGAALLTNDTTAYRGTITRPYDQRVQFYVSHNTWRYRAFFRSRFGEEHINQSQSLANRAPYKRV